MRGPPAPSNPQIEMVSRSILPARRQSLAQALRPYISPILFDVVQTRNAVRLAVNHPPAGWNFGEIGPKAMLFFVIDQDEKTAIVGMVVENVIRYDPAFLAQG